MKPTRTECREILRFSSTRPIGEYKARAIAPNFHRLPEKVARTLRTIMSASIIERAVLLSSGADASQAGERSERRARYKRDRILAMSVIRTCATVTRSAVSRVPFYDNNAAVIGSTAIMMRRDSRQSDDISDIFAIATSARLSFFFFYSICSSASLSVVSRGVFGSYYVSLSRFVMLVVIVLDDLWSWRFALREDPKSLVSYRKITVSRSCLQHPRCPI